MSAKPASVEEDESSSPASLEKEIAAEAAETATETEVETEGTTTAETSTETESEEEEIQSGQETVQDTPTDRQLIEWAKENFGEDVEHYADDAEMLRGLFEARRLVGQRNEDAILGKRYREHQEEFEQYLKTRKEPPPSQSAESPPTFEQFQLWQTQITDANGQIKADAPADLVKKVKQYQDQTARNLFQLAHDPGAIVGPLLERERQQIQEMLSKRQQEQMAEAEDARKAQDFLNANSQWLFVNKRDKTGGTTVRGDQFFRHVTEAAKRGIASVDDQITIALAKLKDSTLPGPPAKRTAQARRKPNVTRADVEIDHDKLIAELSLDQYAARLAELEGTQ
jgi:hypothetical protein